ncbi:MAG: ABC transporter substrate-binding protein [Fusobacterium sp. JB020]|nr:ABC transporter substrate-binding protein [Fusobacterium sp. JB020]
MKKMMTIALICVGLFIALPIFAQGAKEENDEVYVYSIMPEKYASIIFEEFTAETGIKVNFVRLSSGEALSRVIAEKDNPQVDCVWGGPSDTYDAGVKEGVFASYVPAEASKIPENFKSEDGYWTGIGIIPLCFLSNTDFLTKNGIDAPTSWMDLLNPVYKNGLQMADARTSGTATERIYSLVQALGEDEAFQYQKELNSNIQLYTKSGAGGALPVANGQAAAGIFYIVDALDILHQGYPLEISYPSEGVTYGVEASGLLTNCQHPEAGKKLLDWASTKKLGEIMVENSISYIPTRPDVEVNDKALDMSNVNLLEAESTWKGQNREKFVNRFIEEVIQQ